MDSIQHLQVTRNLGAPKDWDVSKGKCGSLPIQDIEYAGAPAMQSLWRPSAHELEALKRGAVLSLIVLGSVHPPVSLFITDDPLKKGA
ncbi:putative glucose-methanol-choline oxidoreductase [Edwardsiella phage vB_EpM_ZHS]|jgi:hypothetical protein|nr:putative glucose-methanol-choline oxidoreductase [Edwardsiella phage vB_EpM_ZHS]